jgi:hypothetical protein
MRLERYRIYIALSLRAQFKFNNEDRNQFILKYHGVRIKGDILVGSQNLFKNSDYGNASVAATYHAH